MLTPYMLTLWHMTIVVTKIPTQVQYSRDLTPVSTHNKYVWAGQGRCLSNIIIHKCDKLSVHTKYARILQRNVLASWKYTIVKLHKRCLQLHFITAYYSLVGWYHVLNDKLTENDRVHAKWWVMLDDKSIINIHPFWGDQTKYHRNKINWSTYR